MYTVQSWSVIGCPSPFESVVVTLEDGFVYSFFGIVVWRSAVGVVYAGNNVIFNSIMVPTTDSNGKITDSNGKRTVNNFDDDNACPVLYLQVVFPVYVQCTIHQVLI